METAFGDLNPFGDPLWYQGLHTPYYTDSHREFRKEVRELIEKHIMPYADEWDEKKSIPREIYYLLGNLGYNYLVVGHPYPDKYGKPPKILENQKIDVFHEMIVVDELARCGSGGITWGISGGLGIGLPPVCKFADEEIRERVVGPCLRGEKIICLAITEPTAGSDVAQLRCSARREGDFYIVNGEKKWITNGIFADYFTVAVRTGGPGAKGISLLLIERQFKGVTTRQMLCSGVWASGTTFISFDDVQVPVKNLIGAENDGFRLIMQNFNHERLQLCVQTIRFARVCLEESYKFSQRRRTFSKKLFEHQVIRWKLAEMARQIEATQCFLDYVAYNMSEMGEEEGNLRLGGLTALLKVQCTKTFEFCSREAQQTFGGLGYTRGGLGAKVERLAREVRAMAVPGGSEEILLDLAIRQSKKISEVAKQFLQKSKL